MAKGVVFKILKGSKSANDPKAPLLNEKHFVYIATRPGTIHNKDCAFGLFGKLPFMNTAEDINNMEKAKTIITSVSRRRKIFRSVLSVDDETGKTKGLYDRANWQDLVIKNINVIAKESDIDRKDFCWVASMHYKKGHPHVHILYWDNGGKVRNDDYIPKERFEIAMEHVRAEFGREIFKEEISERREGAKEIIEAARLELLSLCKEQNVMDALDLNHVSVVELDEIGNRLYDLILACPKSGSLKYAFLPESYKNKLDAMISEIMKITDFRSLQKQYVQLTDEISSYYGNGSEKAEFNRNQALKKLNTSLGNEIMNFIRSFKNELERTAPKELENLKAVICDDTQCLLQSSKRFSDLSKMFPTRRTPLREILTDDFKSKKDEVVNEIISDIRVRTKIQAYIKNINGTQEVPVPSENKKAEMKVLSRETYSSLFRTIDEIVMETLYENAGYDQQMKTDMAVNMLIQVFGSASQGLNQQRSQHQLNKSRSKDISKTAKRDLHKRLEQQGSWEQEL